MEENNNSKLPDLGNGQQNLDSPELTEEQKKEIQEHFNDQATRLGEVFSQCWESEEFKQAFIDDPKAIFDEYGVEYKKDCNYKIIDTPEKTIVHVLPYKGIKKGMDHLCEMLQKHVEGITEDEEKQVLLKDWSWQIYQNTEDTYYVPIPLCPENLTPEELELVNGGCLLFAIFFFVEAASVVTTSNVAAEVFVLAVAMGVAVVDVAALVAVGAVVAAVIAELVAAVQTAYLEYTVSEVTGEILATVISGSKGAVFPIDSNDPRKRGR